jgi:hypothetical protein
LKQVVDSWRPSGDTCPNSLPVGEEELVDAALAEVRRGATWVKVIADFPRVPDFTDVATTM